MDSTLTYNCIPMHVIRQKPTAVLVPIGLPSPRANMIKDQYGDNYSKKASRLEPVACSGKVPLDPKL